MHTLQGSDCGWGTHARKLDIPLRLVCTATKPNTEEKQQRRLRFPIGAVEQRRRRRLRFPIGGSERLSKAGGARARRTTEPANRSSKAVSSPLIKIPKVSWNYIFLQTE
ncbi:hypothetical protein ZWY2020_027017 [Hordeum vulgare]|nr:hypothetical protein ZWY2020_027017 [Hordeum vulgare]